VQDLPASLVIKVGHSINVVILRESVFHLLQVLQQTSSLGHESACLSIHVVMRPWVHKLLQAACIGNVWITVLGRAKHDTCIVERKCILQAREIIGSRQGIVSIGEDNIRFRNGPIQQHGHQGNDFRPPIPRLVTVQWYDMEFQDCCRPAAIIGSPVDCWPSQMQHPWGHPWPSSRI